MDEVNDGCVFCDIVAGKAAACKVYEDDLSMCIIDINPFARGHCLVIPKRHVPFWHDLSAEETQSLFGACRIVANRMMEVYRPEFVCMFARGKRIPHTHVFLVPSHGGDVLDGFFNALEKVQESPQDLAELKREDALERAAAELRRSG